MSVTAAPAADGFFRLYGELWRHGEGKRGTLMLMTALLSGAYVVRLAIPFLAARALDTLQTRGFDGLQEAAGWLALVFACTPASWVLHGFGRVVERNVALHVRSSVSEQLVGRLLLLPLEWHETQHSGATARRVDQSARALFDFTQMQYLYLQSAVRFVGPAVALWLIHPQVGLAAVIGLIVIGATTIAHDRPLMRLARVENDSERTLTATLVDVLGNIVSVHALRQARGVLELVRRRLEAVYVPLRRYIVLNETKWCAVDVLSQALCCALLVLYVWSVSTGAGLVADAQGAAPALAIGSVYMVWEYARQATGVAGTLALHFQTFSRQRTDYAAGDAIRDAATTDLAAPAPPAPWRRLDVQQLGFRHARADREAELENIGTRLQRGRRYAVVGASGSGKSTLLRVLAGLYVADSLTLLRDDVPVGDAAAAARFLRSNATLVPQDTQVFAGTIRENLELCGTVSGTAPRQSLATALALACAGDFIGAADAQLDAPVAERGSNFSGGQRQRLALARAALAAEGSPLLLLDEPTASLDSATEGRVYDGLFEAFADACIVCSVHRLNLLPRFDEVLVLERGRLVDQGPAEALEARCAPFRALLAAHAAERAVAASA